MFTPKLWLTSAGLAVAGLSASPALAGDFGIRFSYRNGSRCHTGRTAHSYFWRGYPALVTCYDRALRRYYRSYSTDVAVCRSRPVRQHYYYAPRIYRPRRAIHHGAHRAVRRSYLYYPSYGGGYQHCYRWRPDHRRSLSGGAYYRSRGRGLGLRFHCRN